jgi:hypothetical protein
MSAFIVARFPGLATLERLDIAQETLTHAARTLQKGRLSITGRAKPSRKVLPKYNTRRRFSARGGTLASLCRD